MVHQVLLKPITAEEVEALEAQGIVREIVDGQWVGESKPIMAGKLHGRIGGRIFGKLFIYLEAHPVGEAYQDNTTYVLRGTKNHIELMRIPDVSFVSAERVDHADPGYYYLAPDLAVEVVSPSERAGEIAAKVKDYLRYGTQQVWVVYPDLGQAIVHLPDGTARTYEDTLPAGDLLPGFALNLGEIFKP
jgi:Uma2 family endonuclease